MTVHGSLPHTLERYDVVVLGGGAAGLTLAMQIKQARPETSILIVEKQQHPVPEATHKVGESTVEIAAHYLRDVLGLEEHLQGQQLNKFGLRMFFSAHDNQDITRRVELGHAVRPPHGVGTYQIDRGRLENALGQEVAARGIGFRSGCRVSDIDLQPRGDDHRLRVRSEGGRSQEIAATWVVDATGRASVLKRQLGLAKKVEHKANAVWFRIGQSIDVDDWSSDPDWHSRIRESRRALSTNHLMGPGYWVWLIPLASGSTSVGIVTDPRTHAFSDLNRFDRALSWLREHEPQCARELELHREDVQDFRVMKDYAYTCEQVFSDARWCLAGEAALFLDPLYSPGLDLIAISNGLICDLIVHGLDGEDIEERAAIHNQMYLIIAEGWLRVYDQQYVLMDNARVMLAKVVWDTAVYWAVPGLLYFHDKVRQLADFPAMVSDLAQFSAAGEHTQRFFREWHAVDQSTAADMFISFYDFDFMARLHIGMTAGLDDAKLAATFTANVRFIEQLSGQLVSTVIAECAADTESPQRRAQAEHWRADPDLMRLVDVYEHDRHDNPTGDGWINLSGAGRDRAEALR